MKRKLVLGFVVLLFVGFVAVNCSAQSNALVGKWFWEEEECYFTFVNDGTLIISSDDNDWKTKYSWKITKDTISLKWIGEEYEPDFQGTWNFKISGSKLTINWDVDDDPLILVKQ
jgi:hypothetical protein